MERWEIVRAVVDLCREPRTLERFRSMLQAWADTYFREHLKEAFRIKHERRQERRRNKKGDVHLREGQFPLPLDSRPRRLDEKYAILAALHDGNEQLSRDRIAPFPKIPLDHENYPKALYTEECRRDTVVGAMYYFLCEDAQAENLNLVIVGTFLDDVRHDLASYDDGPYGRDARQRLANRHFEAIHTRKGTLKRNQVVGKEFVCGMREVIDAFYAEILEFAEKHAAHLLKRQSQNGEPVANPYAPAIATEWAERMELACRDLTFNRAGKLRDEFERRAADVEVERAKIADACRLPVAREAPVSVPGDAMRRLLGLYTNGVADKRIQQAERILMDQGLNADEKLWKLDEALPIPATASAQRLGDLLGVKKQAVSQTSWWATHRKDKKRQEVGRRREIHQERARGFETATDEAEEK